MSSDDSARGDGPLSAPITGLQLAVLRALWVRAEATVADVHAALTEHRRLAPTTVATLLKRLDARGLVAHRKEGRALVYRAAVSEEEVSRQAVDDALDQVFEGDVAAFAAQLLRRRDVEKGDLERIRALIEARERELEPGEE